MNRDLTKLEYRILEAFQILFTSQRIALRINQIIKALLIDQ